MAVILTIIVVMLALALGALAVAVISISAVAVVAQTSALFSQCLVALVLLALGGTIVGSVALRNRVIQAYLARRLLGADADRILIESGSDRSAALPVTFPRKQAWSLPARATAPTPQIPTSPTLPTLPPMPHGWGFDEED